MQSLKKFLIIAALACGVSSGVNAQEWGEFAYISSTMGVSDGRICTGEASRGAIGCAVNAPYVSRTSGWLGIGTSNPRSNLYISDNSNQLLTLDRNSAGTRKSSITFAQQGVNRWQMGIDYNDTNTQNFYIYDAVNPYYRFMLTNYGLGINANIPSATLHIGGAIRMAAEISSTLQPCDANRTGAIKYQSGDFHVCRNGTAWETLSDVASGAASLADRITSGTTQVITRQNTSITLATAGVERVVVGTSGNVGIGQQPFDSTAYGRHLSVYNNISASTASANAGLSIQSTSRNATLHMIAGSTGASLIYFRRDSIDSTEGQGAITYSNAN
ncbi:MAG: hypothetical protein EON60_03990, partial [Alphaproteobacteria bacterium]